MQSSLPCEPSLHIKRKRGKMCNCEKTRHFHAGQARGSMPSKIHSMCTGGGHFPPFSCKVLFSPNSKDYEKRIFQLACIVGSIASFSRKFQEPRPQKNNLKLFLVRGSPD